MRRLLLIALVALSVTLTAGPSSALAVPGGVDGDEPAQQKPEQDDGDCAGGVLLVEQLCDAVDALPGSPAALLPGVGPAVAGKEAAGAAASAVGGGVLGEVTEWMTDAAEWVTSKIQGLIEQTATPELEASWYQDRWREMVALGGGLAVLVAMIALVSAAVRRDPDALGGIFIGMFRAGIGTGLVVPLVVMALSVADGISSWVAGQAAGEAGSKFWGDVADVWGSGDHGGLGSTAIAFLFALVQVIAGIAVWIEMLLRNAGIYVAVLFMAAALAASIWPRLRSWQDRLVSLLFVMIAMKPVIVVVLSLAGSAAAAGGGGDKDLGLVLAAVVILVLAAFTPWVLMMLISIDTEASWTAGSATGGAKARIGSGVAGVGGRLGGAVTTAGGAIAGRRGGGMGGGGRRGGSAPGGSAPGGSGPGGSGPGGSGPSGAGGGGGGHGPSTTTGGGSPKSSGSPVAPTGTVAAAAGLAPAPSGGSKGGRAADRRGGTGRPSVTKGSRGASRPRPAAPAPRSPRRDERNAR